MKNMLMIIFTAAILFGTIFLRIGLIPHALLFGGIILFITTTSIFIASKIYPEHKAMLGLCICGFILLLFVPSLAVTDLAEPLNGAAFNRTLTTFIIAPIICVGTTILAYRHYFIIN